VGGGEKRGRKMLRSAKNKLGGGFGNQNLTWKMLTLTVREGKKRSPHRVNKGKYKPSPLTEKFTHLTRKVH